MKNMKKLVASVLCAVVLMSMVAFGSIGVNAASKSPLDSVKDVYASFTADNFSMAYTDICGDAVENDPDSSVGKAAVFSYDKRSATGDTVLMNAMISVPSKPLVLNIYGGEPAAARTVGEITSTQLQANEGKYVAYKFEDVELIPSSGEYYFYFFDCWGLKQYFSEEQLNTLKGKLVDVYLSMKVTGNVSSSTKGSTPTYYVDRILVAKAVPGTDAHTHEFGKWESAGDDVNHIRRCNSCSETQSQPHDWDEGQVTKEPTETSYGEKMYTCSVCGATKYEELDKIRDEEPQNTTTTTNASGTNSNAEPKKPANTNVGIWIAVGMFALAAVIVVIALILRKRNSQQSNDEAQN